MASRSERPTSKKCEERLVDPVIFDGRNIHDPERMEREGFTYYGIGLGHFRHARRSRRREPGVDDGAILVTGAAGFIGLFVAERLLAAAATTCSGSTISTPTTTPSLKQDRLARLDRPATGFQLSSRSRCRTAEGIRRCSTRSGSTG